MKTAILLIASSMYGQTYTVTNKMPQFTVVNKCRDPFEVANKTPFVPKTKLTAFKTQTVVTTRAPAGHTHTCPRCGTTWDHAANAGHNCPKCGTAQYVQDRSPRPVTVVRTIQVPADAPVPPTRAAAARQFAPVLAFPRATAGCANGSCAYVR